MNTIPLIFNERQVRRTVLGGAEDAAAANLTGDASQIRLPLSVILLNSSSGSHYRGRILETLVRLGFASIVSIENSADNYNIEDLAQRFPSVKFIVPLEPVTVGDMINIGMGELDGGYVLVIRDTVRLSSSLITPHLARRLVSSDVLCVAPRLMTPRLQPLPVKFSPSVENGVFKPLSSASITEKSRTLYPFDFMGLYHHEKFVRLGGYDYTIRSPYWQNLDFSVRAWLWGEQLLVSPVFQIAYDDEIPVEDATPDQYQLRFFLKNLAPRLKTDYGYIPISKFFGYQRRSSFGFADSYRQFTDARRWVSHNKYRFQMDMNTLIRTWETVQL
ncbi:hypothetical protein [Treponema brennaborense]|uniref:Glycosyl transferase family 2 n=1 Tax=Treponema brennaborense (strain DSM 12168 / CIP 105900 / DD5/3) TaxID=906968 RepID=F4LIN4_TREBD|nr:hypothetical protein [Treponema brennaborense]AEE17259.1 hypothetical protein Trebr_1839 [Treponema brennaborense DSM 12168]